MFQWLGLSSSFVKQYNFRNIGFIARMETCRQDLIMKIPVHLMCLLLKSPKFYVP